MNSIRPDPVPSVPAILDAATTPQRGPSPVPQSERITALDTLRGFALLGILLMNVVLFALYKEAYNNPTAAGGATGLNLGVWAFLSVVAEGKMRCLFSLIFGASTVLLTSRLEGRTDAADLYYRRNLWLILFGIAHAYLLWHGEILFPYATCALILYPFRKMSARGLLIVGAACVAMTITWSVFAGMDKRDEIAAGRAAVEKAAKGETLSKDEDEAKRKWDDAKNDRNPDAATLAEDAKAWRGNPIEVIRARGKVVFGWHSTAYYHAWNFDVWGMMFLGMGLFKLGVLSAVRSYRFYAILLLIGYGVGLPLGVFRAKWLIDANFDPATEFFSGTLYDIQRLLVALGHLAVLLLLCKSGRCRFVTMRLGAIGQMALTNYIMQSVICALVFTGYGLGLYGTLERHQLYWLVLGIWTLQFFTSVIWLRHFRFGPLEWCWRSLTYWKRQPFRGAAVSAG